MEQKLTAESISSYFQKISNNQKLLIKIAAILFILSMVYKFGYVIGKAIYNTTQ